MQQKFWLKTWHHAILLLCSLLWASNNAGWAHSQTIQAAKPTLIPIIILQGASHQAMGRDYGKQLKTQLHGALKILKDYYIQEHGVSYQQMRDQAQQLYERFPTNYQTFIAGVAQGAELSLDDAKILNAMETLGPLVKKDKLQQCAFLAVPHNTHSGNGMLIGRNYDFPPPYDRLAHYLTVTILKEDHAIPTAFIAIAGEIYCPTCINAQGIFMELNNGMPSGGYTIQQHTESLLIKLLQISQHASSLQTMQQQLEQTKPDYSLIINTADRDHVQSYEFSSTLGLKTVIPSTNTIFASTNFFLNPSWKNIPQARDDTTWLGVQRRNNLLRLAQKNKSFSVTAFQDLMDKQLHQGGAVWKSTIYQLIYDTQDQALYLKINAQRQPWQKLSLTRLFSVNPEP